MRILRFTVLSALVATAAFVASCVGDDPATGNGITPEGGAGSDAPASVNTSTPDSGVGVAGDGSPDDASGPLDAEAAAPFDAGVPASLLGNRLALWLDATNAVANGGNFLVSWKEIWHQTPADNLVGQPLGGGLKPSFSSNAANGHPAVHFIGGNSVVLTDTPVLQWGTGDFMMFFVLKYGDTSQQGLLWDKQDGNGGLRIYVPDDESQQKIHAQTGTPSADGLLANMTVATLHVLTVLRASSTFQVRVDGVAQGTQPSATSDVSAPGTAASIGFAGSYAFNGDLAEVIGVKGTVTSTERDTIESHLKQKYATP